VRCTHDPIDVPEAAMNPALATWLRRIIGKRSGDSPTGVPQDLLELRPLRRVGWIGGPVIATLRYRNNVRKRDDILLVSINAKTGSVTVLKDISEGQAAVPTEGAAGSDPA
jgi:hypothetical protein